MASAVNTFAQLGVTRAIGSPVDLPKRAHALLAERFPLARTRHKPLSILRQEGRRALEQLFDSQVPPPPRPERDKLIEEILGEADGFGPLEELFRDETVKEIMVLAAAQVITRKEGGGWVPTSVRFRDPSHQRSYLRRLTETNPPLVSDAGQHDAGFDVRLANGFRVVGILPPDVLDQPPLAVFTRGQPAVAAATPVPVPLTASGTLSTGSAARIAPIPPPGGSGTISFNAVTRGPASSGRFPKPDTGSKGPIPSPLGASKGPMPSPLPPAQEPAVSEFYMPANLDPMEKVRRRVSERIIRKCAAAGVYNLSAIPAAELQRVILAHVEELNTAERMNLSDQEVQIVALEIFTGMRR